MVDPQIVVLVVAGSSPVGHPTFFRFQNSSPNSGLDSGLDLGLSSVRNCPRNSDSKLFFPLSLERLRLCPIGGALFNTNTFTPQPGDETSSVNPKVLD